MHYERLLAHLEYCFNFFGLKKLLTLFVKEEVFATEVHDFKAITSRRAFWLKSTTGGYKKQIKDE